MSGISLQTYELVMRWEALVRKRAAVGRNGLELPDYWVRAISELRSAACMAYVVSADPVPGSADETKVDTPPEPVAASPQVEQIDVATAATRLGISQQAVRKRIAESKLAARKIGRSWLIDWTKEAA